jgi:ubiquinone/menaquinone biosynthesis C-methylase UbiE
MKEYYDARAPEYDEWYLGRGRFADRDRPNWDEELAALLAAIEALPPKRTLDVACGTGFLTRHLRGDVTGLDQSARMLAIAAQRRPDAAFVQGDGLDLPFEDGFFERLFTGHFYGHLEEDQRVRFLAEAHRVAAELVVVDASRAHSPVAEEIQERILNNGSRWTVYKRYFEPDKLAAELGGRGETLFAGNWFVVVRA